MPPHPHNSIKDTRYELKLSEEVVIAALERRLKEQSLSSVLLRVKDTRDATTIFKFSAVTSVDITIFVFSNQDSSPTFQMRD